MKYWHEDAKAWLYVVLQALCEDWAVELPVGGDLVSDVSFVYQGTRFYVEIDLGNEEPKHLFHKIDRYTQYAGSGEKVIFVLGDGKYKAERQGQVLMEFLEGRRLGNFVTVSFFDNLISHPTANVLYSPKDGWISLSQLG